MMESYRYLGALPKIGNTLWYGAHCNDEWVALVSFSAAALKCAVRDDWIGWMERFGFPGLLLETFVDPGRCQGTLHRATNWPFVGYTKGDQRTPEVRYFPFAIWVKVRICSSVLIEA
ncbi:MAG: hypothetical protein ACU843_08970 [Gammaproteobacteria bacterium]